MSTNRRVQRVESLLRSGLASLLVSEVSDPALKEIVVTDVQCTADLKLARVYYGVSQAENASPLQRKAIEAGFKRATPFFRRRLSESLDLRHAPDFEFRQDSHPQTLQRIYSLLDEVKQS